MSRTRRVTLAGGYSERKLAALLLLAIYCAGLLDYEVLRESKTASRRAQLRRLEEEDDDRLVEQQQTTLPTLILTPAPTSPTGAPSTPPSLFPTIFSEPPTNAPSVSPSGAPSISTMPSLAPSVSFAPSVSMVPSIAPSNVPSDAPSWSPTEFPSNDPSRQPSSIPSGSPSESPSISALPSLEPSFSPTDFPTTSNKPSLSPSISSAPTVTPSPTMLPSISPTNFPTDTPSDIPTPRPPTLRPSDSPTNLPSATPSMLPSVVPTWYPTLSVVPFSEPKITMTLQGLPSALSPTQQLLWENITSEHILRFYRKFNDVEPGVIPVNVTNVMTTFQQQLFQSSRGRLEIEYAQTLVLGRYRDIGDEKQFFVIPFTENSQDYVIALLTGLDLDSLISVESVIVGEAEPTATPDEDDDSGISVGALVAISISIVLAACVIVAFLLWDKKAKSQRRSQVEDSSPHQLQEGAHGSQDDMSFSGERETRTPPRQYSSQRVASNNYPSNNTIATDLSTIEEPMSLSGNHDRRQRQNSRGAFPTLSMRPNMFNGRVPDESELSVSDSEAGGPPSESGSDGYIIEPPTIPSTAGNGHFGPDSARPSGPLSPMHIADGEDDELGRGYSYGSDAYGLSRTSNSPALFGFNMHVEELE